MAETRFGSAVHPGGGTRFGSPDYAPLAGFLLLLVSDATANKTVGQSALAGLGTIPAGSAVRVPESVSGHAPAYEMSGEYWTGRIGFADWLPAGDVEFAGAQYRPGAAGAWESLPILYVAALDAVPAAFSFSDAVGVVAGSVSVSNAVTVSGINTSAAVSVSGAGQYRINGGAWVTSAGVVYPGDVVELRHTNAGAASTATSTTLTVNGVSDTFMTTTAAAGGGGDTDPPVITAPGNLAVFVPDGMLGLPREHVDIAAWLAGFVAVDGVAGPVAVVHDMPATLYLAQSPYLITVTATDGVNVTTVQRTVTLVPAPGAGAVGGGRVLGREEVYRYQAGGYYRVGS